MIDFRTVAKNLRENPLRTLSVLAGRHTNSGEACLDRIIKWRFFPSLRSGVMIEVGAANPHILSMGGSFRRAGWRVVSIEPNPAYAAIHRAMGHTIHEVACADFDRDDVPFQVVTNPYAIPDNETAFSAIAVKDELVDPRDRELYARSTMREIKVNIRKLDTILAEERIVRVDLLVADVEGWEIEVMRGLTLNPTVVMLENNFHDDRYRKYMEARGYRRSFKIIPNEVYRLHA